MSTGHDPSGALIGGYEGIICDLDGVVYRGAEAVVGAPEALQAVVRRGIRVVYATNNASREPADVSRHLQALGAPATPDAVVTSSQAGADHLAHELEAGARVLALGGPGVALALEAVGLEAVAPPAAGRGRVDAVLQGLGSQLTVGDFTVAARHLARGVTWVATNADSTLPLEWGLAPGNGAYVDLLAASAGRSPFVVGKPFPPLYRLAIDRLGTTAVTTLAIGDRLNTDIAGAVGVSGMHSAWVLTGIDRPSSLLRPDAEHGGCVPTYVLGSLTELLEPYAVPRRHDGGWACGRAVVHLREGLVVKNDEGAAIESVRAGLAVLLEARERGSLAPAELHTLAAQLDDLLDRALAGAD